MPSDLKQEELKPQRTKAHALDVVYRDIEGDSIALIRQPNRLSIIAVIVNPYLPARYVYADGRVEEINLDEDDDD